MQNKEEIEKMEVEKWLQFNEIPNFIRNYIEQLEFKNSALKTEHKFNIGKIEQLETSKQKLIEELEADKMEQFDDYIIYLQEKYLGILKGNLPST